VLIPAGGRRAAIIGKPVGHSLSPPMHNAGFTEVGLTDWDYTRVEVDEGELAGFLASVGPEWIGFSLTMPLKEEALEVADHVDPLAATLGAVNTLIRGADGWTAYNTDAPGMDQALRAAGITTARRMAILGGGGTARAALGAAKTLGAEVTAFVRRPEVVDELRPVAHALGLGFTVEGWGRVSDAVKYDIVVSTVPKGAPDALAVAAWAPPTVVFDVVYDPWPTAITAGAQRAGCAIVSGLDLLYWQALPQFELFTGRPAPAGVMRTALFEAAGARPRV
jgi:shikimate dehydrogenase